MKRILFLSVFAVISIQSMTSQEQLFEGCRNNNLALVEEALKEGANINFKKRDTGLSPLMFAVGYDSKDIVAKLLQLGADVNDWDQEGTTPLIACASDEDPDGFIDLAEILIKAGANVNIQNVRGLSALMVAVTCENFALVKLLINNGAIINQKDAYNKTAIDIAKEENYLKILKFLNEVEESIKRRKEKISKEVEKYISGGQKGPLQYILEYAEEYVYEEDKKENEELI